MITFGSRTVLSGHYGCVNCESVTGYFAFLVVAFGVLAFGIYAARQRRRSPGLPEKPEDDKVQVDQEGWETKLSTSEETEMNVLKAEDWQPRPSEEEEPAVSRQDREDEGWETKPEN